MIDYFIVTLLDRFMLCYHLLGVVKLERTTEIMYCVVNVMLHTLYQFYVSLFSKFLATLSKQITPSLTGLIVVSKMPG
jgi:hypothetical protein